MSFLSGQNNDNFFNNCQSLENLTVTLRITEDLVTAANNGFSLQLNCYPQPNQIPQGQSLTQQEVGDLELTWLQYLIIVQGGYAFEIQYWATGSHGYAAGEPWPPGYTPDPPGTTPWLPVFPHTADFAGFGSSSSSQLAAGSLMTIALKTEPRHRQRDKRRLQRDRSRRERLVRPHSELHERPAILDLRVSGRPGRAPELGDDIYFWGRSSQRHRVQWHSRSTNRLHHLQRFATGDRRELERNLRSAHAIGGHHRHPDRQRRASGHVLQLR